VVVSGSAHSRWSAQRLPTACDAQTPSASKRDQASGASRLSLPVESDIKISVSLELEN